ncbi:putative Alpha-ketoglutarate-dependent dioxygenase alkB-like protein 7, mitochondrial [Hypsibius exemplaris]|uniref:Alpha-ketoglutarate-dependent dioxygenase alkB-like protein 7, mitochondrial n=1 Tax=Hypsibius exemplaris TaxID=2072580 RepID=A0A1W0WDS8_HYPEX|nr:putative Alpha-ketoglutarate-dependent dioxygenase alkB-like protein 7, mitochondrial [Hypsibius exemplaris]
MVPFSIVAKQCFVALVKRRSQNNSTILSTSSTFTACPLLPLRPASSAVLPSGGGGKKNQTKRNSFLRTSSTFAGCSSTPRRLTSSAFIFSGGKNLNKQTQRKTILSTSSTFPSSGLHARDLVSSTSLAIGGKMLIVQAIMRLFDVHSRRFETILQPRNAALAYFRSESTSPEIDEPESPPIKNSPGNFEFVSQCPPELREQILLDFVVIDDFLSEAEERSLLEEAESQIARVRYENEENWDNAIIGYRETERKNWNSENKKIMKRVRDLAFPPGVSQLVNVHILDLAKDGYIKPHVDSIRFCGDTIAGLSLLSPAVLRLVQEAQKDPVIDVLLKRRSLYIMKGIARYNYTHEILRESQSVFKGEVVERDRRISLIFRNEPDED